MRLPEHKVLLRGLAYACLLIGKSVSAQPGAPVHDTGAVSPVELVGIEYRAHAACPPRAEFLSEVFRRTHNARPAEGEGGGRRFLVVLADVDGMTVGSVESSADGVRREFREGTCKEVASALALSTALAIDPLASFSPASPPAPTPREQAPAVVEEMQPPAPRPSGRLAVGVEGAARGGLSPDLAPSAALFVEGRRALPAGWRPSLRLSLAYAQTEAEAGLSHARFRLFAVRPEACAHWLRIWQGAVGVGLPCLAFEAAAVQARTKGVSIPLDATRRRLAVQALARVRLDGGDRAWFVEVAGGADLAIDRYRFVLEAPETVVYDAPVLSAVAGLSLGVYFF